MKLKEKWFPNNVMRDSVMQISVSAVLKRGFGRNTSTIRMWQEYIHRGPSFQQVKNTLYMYIQDFIFYFRTCSFTIFCELQIAINGLGVSICHRKSVSWMGNWVGQLHSKSDVRTMSVQCCCKKVCICNGHASNMGKVLENSVSAFLWDNRPFVAKDHMTYPPLNLIPLWILARNGKSREKKVELPSLRSVALEYKIWRLSLNLEILRGFVWENVGG